MGSLRKWSAQHLEVLIVGLGSFEAGLSFSSVNKGENLELKI